MKNKLIYQTIILFIGQITARIMSVIFIMVIARLLKEKLPFYSLSYIPFSLFLDISSIGIIPGISKLISKSDNENKYYYLKVGTIIYFLIGVFSFILMNLFIILILKKYISNNVILYNLYFSSFTLFIFPLLSFYRGYNQGKFKMMPTSLSLIVENTIRIFLTIIWAKSKYNNIQYYIFIINFLSYLLSLIIIIPFSINDYYKRRKKSSIYLMLKTCITLGIVTLFFSIFQIIDYISLSYYDINTGLFNAYLYKTIRIIYFPIIIGGSIAGAITPKFNKLLTTNEKDKAIFLAQRITRFLIFLMPILTLGIYIFNSFIFRLIFTNESYSYVLRKTCILLFFVTFYKVLIGITQGFKEFYLLSVTTFISIIFKLVFNYMFTPLLSYNASTISSIISLTILILTAYYILKRNNIKLFKYDIKQIIIMLFYLIISSFISLILVILFFSQMYSIEITILLFYILTILIYIIVLIINRVINSYLEENTIKSYL